MGRVSFVVGAAAGYVLGTRAGRRRYEQIKSGASKVWHSDPVQNRVGAAQERAKAELKAAVPAVTAKALDAASTRAKAAAARARNTIPGRPLAARPADPPTSGVIVTPQDEPPTT